MVRDPLQPWEIERGRQLGAVLRKARGPASLGEVAVAAGISVETLRKIETGRIATPAFFTVAALARILGLSLDDLAVRVVPDDRVATGARAS
jgi:transcriptional regulator with XRE-family HTH domain